LIVCDKVLRQPTTLRLVKLLQWKIRELTPKNKPMDSVIPQGMHGLMSFTPSTCYIIHYHG